MTAAVATTRPASSDIDDTILDALRRGDPAACAHVVDRYGRLLRSVARSCRLSEQDAQDVVQTTWCRLFENLDRIREPEFLGQWLVVTVRRESWRLSSRRARDPELLGAEVGDDLVAGDEPVEDTVLRRAEAERLWQAIDRLPEQQRRLIRALLTDEDRSYDEIADALGMPRGSLGPTRLRALKRLRLMLADGSSNTTSATQAKRSDAA